MSASPISPATLSGGFILMDAAGRAVLRSVAFQYNPDTLSRTLTPRGAKIDAGDRLEGLRLVGPPVETLKLEAEFDAVDRVGPSGGVGDGVAGDLAALETIISPAAADLLAEQRLAAAGALEVLPTPAPLVLLALGPTRVQPVRITDMGIVEEMFDIRLTPIRARVSLTCRVLNSDDLPPGGKASSLFFAALQRRERLAAARSRGLGAFGLSGQP